jgi:hypothetical protein
VNISRTSAIRLGSFEGFAEPSRTFPFADNWRLVFFKMFLYQFVFDPFTGRRYSLVLSSESANQTDSEIFFPDLRPVTVMLTSSVEASAFLNSESGKVSETSVGISVRYLSFVFQPLLFQAASLQLIPERVKLGLDLLGFSMGKEMEIERRNTS